MVSISEEIRDHNPVLYPCRYTAKLLCTYLQVDPRIQDRILVPIALRPSHRTEVIISGNLLILQGRSPGLAGFTTDGGEKQDPFADNRTQSDSIEEFRDHSRRCL